MFTRHTVRWFDASDDAQTVNTTVYFSPTHHEHRKTVDEKNEDEAVNRAAYDDACAMGRAVIVEHVRERNGEA